MKKINFIFFIFLFVIISFSLDYLGGQGYSMIPDFRIKSGYDYYKLEGVSEEPKRYSYAPLPNFFEAGYTKTTNKGNLYDFKFSLGPLDGLYLMAGGYNIGITNEQDNYYIGGAFNLESIGGSFTGVFFYKNDEITWGWAYEQMLMQQVSYVIEKRGDITNKGYKIQVSGAIYYEKIEIDTEDRRNLPESEYVNIFYLNKY
ncbi:MAG: hypothetical protein C0601_03910 [Candidatus Muiribacterium halophilum]|uniref:Uncharacterized protein n=1 Tax=Muiribacterium halophilum TaxID=2053465 RepID=A0A2N5ZJ55_MUIH1|nr:MAG: hypothetical protein C0601_03910 [Candidatus Muirbacterium halophilum]